MSHRGCPNCGKTISDDSVPCPHCGAGQLSTLELTCEKCKQGVMTAKRIPRMGHGLSIVGYTLVVPSLLLLTLTTACGVFVVGSSNRGFAGERIENAKRAASEELLNIRDVPRSAAEDFAKTGSVPQEVLSALPLATRDQVEATLATYRRATATDERVAAMSTGIAGLGMVAIYVLCLPFLVVGLLLLRKKNVWQCKVCAYVFDRA